jgi:hypothetical protein
MIVFGTNDEHQVGSVNRRSGNHIQSRHLQSGAGSHWQGCMQQPTLPLANLCEICHRAPGSSAPVVRRHERPICRHILDIVTVSASRYEHHEQAIIPYTSKYIFLVGIPRHVLQSFMRRGRKGKVAFAYVHAAVVALENLSGA